MDITYAIEKFTNKFNNYLDTYMDEITHLKETIEENMKENENIEDESDDEDTVTNMDEEPDFESDGSDDSDDSDDEYYNGLKPTNENNISVEPDKTMGATTHTYWLNTLTDEEYIDIEMSIYEMIDEYLKTDILQMSTPSFHENMVRDITSLLFTHLENADICKEENIEDLEEMVQCVCNRFFKMGIIPPRSYKNKSKECMPKKKYTPLLTEEEKASIQSKIEYLKSVPQPKQKTQEWYEHRWQILTASNIWKAFGSESQVNSLIYEKCKPFEMFGQNTNVLSTLHWGVKYEPLSIIIYEDMVKKTDIIETKVSDFGCINHSTYSFIGASPDGINVCESSPRYGRMVEIKNIVNREITGIPKEEYWIQMQIQMETCDLDHCDFVETQFKEFETEEQFYMASNISNISDTSNSSKKYLYKGVLLYFIRKITDLTNINNEPYYVYMPLHLEEKTEIDEWIQTQKELLRQEYSLYEVQYWYLEKFSCVYVKRNKEWFASAILKLQEIWNIIERERQTGYTHRMPKKKIVPRIEVVHENNGNTHISGMPQSNRICLIKLDSSEADEYVNVDSEMEEYEYEGEEEEGENA
jgi:putative phage-type endonuclease